MTSNLLGQETSPYLLQHRDNPVHWRPWGPDAILAAQQENKPILLSIGYAACHWCHVMAHESFENKATARQINVDFIAVKVDREERPDVDMLYQSALTLLGQRGGWPLTMFLTPDSAPFWGGTYFPAEARYGLPAFRDVLARVIKTYRTRPDQVAVNARTLTDRLRAESMVPPGPAPDRKRLAEVRASYLRMVDTVDGGVLGAPKFPNAPIFTALWAWSHDAETDPSDAAAARKAVLTTLDHLCQGGIYDHLGGGFCRYSTDEFWLVPHFEKMLYDNAALIELLTLVWQETHSLLYARRVSETIGWLERDMMTEDGAFAASLDADSDGVEGRYYVWSAAEIDYLLTPATARQFQNVYGVRPAGNWDGTNILHRNHPLGIFDGARDTTLDEARQHLLRARRDRAAPTRDDKILADWNGMMIAALAQAAFAFRRPAWHDLAARCFRTVREKLFQPGDKLFHSRRLGRNGADGLLDDYVQMARAALLLYETSGEVRYLHDAMTWVDTADRGFWDAVAGGYYFAPDHTLDLLVRTKSAADQSTPSGNGVMVEVLARLSVLTGIPRYAERAACIVSAFSESIAAGTNPLATLLNAGAFLQNATHLVVVGNSKAADYEELLEAIGGVSIPHRILRLLRPGDTLPHGHPVLPDVDPGDHPWVSVCQGGVCSLPIRDAAVLRQHLLKA